MSELTTSDSHLESVSVPSASDRRREPAREVVPDSPASSVFDALETSSSTEPAREGLPSSFRMRHDAHYVDEIEARATRVTDSSMTRAPRHATRQSSAGTPTPGLTTRILSELCHELDGLSSCLNLLPAQRRPLRERVGLELAQVEARRAGRLAQCLRLLLEEPPLVKRTVSATHAFRRAAQELHDELQLARVALTIDFPDPVPHVWADEHVLTASLSALLGGLVAMLDVGRPPAGLRATASSDDGESVVLNVHVEGVDLAGEVSRLFDLDWVDRPGGIAVGAALAAARRIALLHHGRLEASAPHAGTFLVSLRLPVSN